jgi:hypothetical protein
MNKPDHWFTIARYNRSNSPLHTSVIAFFYRRSSRFVFLPTSELVYRDLLDELRSALLGVKFVICELFILQWMIFTEYRATDGVHETTAGRC